MRLFDSTARRIGRLATVGQIAARTVLPVDTNPVPRSWQHITKVDPEDDKLLPLLAPLYLQETDAVSVGGSTAVTEVNTESTFRLLSPLSPPVFHEPSDPTHVTDYTREVAAFIAVPEVLNGTVEAIVGELGAGIERVLEELAPTIVDDAVPAWTPTWVRTRLADVATSWLLATAVFEAYIVQNPDSAAARQAGVGPDDVLDPAEAKRRAMVADRRLGSPVVYVEYSGTFGGTEAEEVVEAIRDGVSWSRVWYGGGVARRADARAMLDAGADTIVVGNVFHDVAAEEVTLLTRARDALSPDVTRSEVAGWLDEQVDVSETAAAAYLATVPACASPAETARDRLVETVATWNHLRAAADRLSSEPSMAEISRVAAAHGPRFEGLSAEANELWSTTALAAVSGVDQSGDGLATHLSAASVESPGNGGEREEF